MNPTQIPAHTRGTLPARLREQISLTLQTLLTLTIIVWVLNLPAKAGFNFYTEQFLLVVLGFGFALSYLLIRARGGAENQAPTPWWDALAGFAGLAACLYLAVFYPTIVNEVVNRPLDAVLISALLFLLVIEATRRCAGMTLVIVIGVLVAYALLGDLLPGQFVSRPVQFTRLLVYLGLDSNAMIGSSLAIASIVVVPFILMGQVLSRCGGGDFFADLAMALMGRYRGGSAKISVVGSALFGMISGSAVSNVAAVGVITIPMMKRSGFKPHVAAAIEAVGSTGGQLAPPVMGAAAFLMAELLQVPYSAVLIAAIIPAFLYYLALFIQVDLEAAKMGIAGEPMDRLPAVRDVMRHGWYFPIPFIVLVVGMMQFNVAAEYAALQAAALFIILNMLFGYRGKRVPLGDMFRTIVSTGKASVDILMICAASGLVIGILNLTGLAFGLTLQLLALSGDSLALLLVMTAVIGIVLGMGMPTVGVYILLATLVAPALVKAGVSPMAAHMFVMYFGMMSMVTPPVAMAAFAAANLAQCDPSKAGWTATRIGWCSYLVPFMFVVSPSLLMVGPAGGIIWTVIAASLGIFVGTVAMVGYFLHPIGVIERILFMVSGVLMLVPADAFEGAIYTDIGGLVLVLALTARHWSRRPRVVPESSLV